MIRVSCACKVCRVNAEKVGAPFPLAAEIPQALADQIGKRVHDVVYIAWEPGALGEALRQKAGIKPA